MSNDGNPKVTEQDFAASSDQHIFWLDIPVNDFLFMSILESVCDLFHIGDNGGQWYPIPLGIALAESALGDIVHHQEWCAICHPKIECSHNMRMLQLRYQTGFLVEVGCGVFVS